MAAHSWQLFILFCFVFVLQTFLQTNRDRTCHHWFASQCPMCVFPLSFFVATIVCRYTRFSLILLFLSLGRDHGKSSNPDLSVFSFAFPSHILRPANLPWQDAKRNRSSDRQKPLNLSPMCHHLSAIIRQRNDGNWTVVDRVFVPVDQTRKEMTMQLCQSVRLEIVVEQPKSQKKKKRTKTMTKKELEKNAWSHENSPNFVSYLIPPYRSSLPSLSLTLFSSASLLSPSPSLSSMLPTHAFPLWLIPHSFDCLPAYRAFFAFVVFLFVCCPRAWEPVVSRFCSVRDMKPVSVLAWYRGRLVSYLRDNIFRVFAPIINDILALTSAKGFCFVFSVNETLMLEERCRAGFLQCFPIFPNVWHPTTQRLALFCFGWIHTAVPGSGLQSMRLNCLVCLRRA